MQHRRIEPALPRSLQCAGKDPVELRAVIGDQQQIDAAIDRLDHGLADVVLVDRAHHEVVGHHRALVSPFVPDDSLHDLLRVRRGAIGIDSGERDMADHEGAARMRQHLAERKPISYLQFLHRRVETGTEMMRVGPYAADAGKMLERGADACLLEPADIGTGDRADDDGIGRNRALADQRMEIEAIATLRRLEVEHRREVEIDTEVRKLTAVDAAELFRLGLLLVGSKSGERRERRHLGQRRREMPDDAAFLVRGDDQRRQAGGAPLVLERREFGAQRLDGPAADVVAGDIDLPIRPCSARRATSGKEE